MDELNKQSVSQLKEICKSHKIDYRGLKKKEMIEKIIEHEQGDMNEEKNEEDVEIISLSPENKEVSNKSVLSETIPDDKPDVLETLPMKEAANEKESVLLETLNDKKFNVSIDLPIKESVVSETLPIKESENVNKSCVLEALPDEKSVDLEKLPENKIKQVSSRGSESLNINRIVCSKTSENSVDNKADISGRKLAKEGIHSSKSINANNKNHQIGENVNKEAIPEKLHKNVNINDMDIVNKNKILWDKMTEEEKYIARRKRFGLYKGNEK